MVRLRIFYHHMIYWVTGTLPETHHVNLANCWLELNNYRKCIEHCEKYLQYENSNGVKAMSAYCFAAQAEWEEAAKMYRSISNIFSTPSFALGLAEVELRRGNIVEARKIVATVNVNNPNPQHDVKVSLEYLNKELADSTSPD